MDYRFDATCRAASNEGARVAEVKVTVLATYGLAEGSQVNQETLQQFGQDVAFLAVYPYIRETVQSLASRVGVHDLTLGLVRRGERVPKNVTVGTSPKLLPETN